MRDTLWCHMAEPITISLAAAVVAKFCGEVVLHVGYHESHHFYRQFLERWQQAPIDPATGLPRNHDLQEASRKALRQAAQAAALVEGIRSLQPQFTRLPEAFGPLMGSLVRDYREASRTDGAEPDLALLTPVVEILQRLERGECESP